MPTLPFFRRRSPPLPRSPSPALDIPAPLPSPPLNVLPSDPFASPHSSPTTSQFPLSDSTTVSRTSSPARRPTFNVGSPQDDRRSSIPSSPRRSSGSSGSSSDSDDEDDDLVRFKRIGVSRSKSYDDGEETPRGREPVRDSGFFDESAAVVVKKPVMTLDLSAITVQERVPFPKDGEDSPSGVPFPAASGPPSPNILPRTPSTPIILSNGAFVGLSIPQ